MSNKKFSKPAFKKCAIASVLSLSSLATVSAYSETMISGTGTFPPDANFTMKSAGGFAVGTFNDVTGDIGGNTWAVASPSPFFGNIWTAHGGTTFGPGSYTLMLLLALVR